MANWQLQHCCNHDQVIFLAVLGVCAVVILALWRTILLMPFKLVTVFIHEASHAIACKLTCGHRPGLETYFTSSLINYGSDNRVLPIDFSNIDLPAPISFPFFPRPNIQMSEHVLQHPNVEGIKVHADEGGTTETRGGVYWFILPAGYLGSSFWGMVLVLASTTLLTARIAAGCLAITLVVVLFVAQNWTLRGLCIGFLLFVAVVWVLQETTTIHILRYIILFIGVMNSLFSVYDIYDDLISRRVHSSDAEKFAEVCPCPCTGVGWGVIWGFISFLFLCGAMYLSMVILS